MVVDCCCSVGGNLIQFALEENTKYALGIDMNEMRIQYAKNNAHVYNVPLKKIDFVTSDISKVDFIDELGFF
jgi:2-polyprenyl-3-methyl-5-hydroxy-6-metoxy-1,4-benzoquinol methylase